VAVEGEATGTHLETVHVVAKAADEEAAPQADEVVPSYTSLLAPSYTSL